MKIIFLDIDGPMIPGRAYTMPGQSKPLVKIFDPCAVGLLNNFCETRDWKIVVHSSWLRVFGPKETYDHCISQGLDPKHFHEDALCEENFWRYTRVARWLHTHPDVTHYSILDDEPYAEDLSSEIKHPKDLEHHLVLVDFEDGLTMSVMNRLGGRDARRKE